MDRRSRALAAALSVLSFTSVAHAIPSWLGGRSVHVVAARQEITQGPFTYMGCYAEPPGARALPMVIDDDEMTRELCATLCGDKRYFGVEWSRECWCGNELLDGTEQADEADCNYPCIGDATTMCGAGLRLSLFENLSWQPPVVTPPAPIEGFEAFEYQGCFVDDGAPRPLPVVHDGDNMSPEVCAQLCPGSKYIALEYGRECWCGNALAGEPLEVGPEECSFNCAGDASQKCGAGWRMSLYMNANLEAPEEPEVPEVPETPAPEGGFRVGDYVSEGCWLDADRTLPYVYADDGMTLEMCAAAAAENSYEYFGLEWTRECWMGNELKDGAEPADAATCDMPCGGDATQNCGGGMRLNLFKYSPPPVLERTLDLEEAMLENAEIVWINGERVVRFLAPPGGEASLDFPEGTVEPPNGDDPCRVRLELNVEGDEEEGPLTVRKRQQLALCTLTIMVGPTIIYTGQLWTTDGSFTTVTTMAVAPGLLTSLIVIQYCPVVSIPVIIRPPVVEIAPPASTTTTSTTSESSTMPTTTTLPPATTTSSNPITTTTTDARVSSPPTITTVSASLPSETGDGEAPYTESPASTAATASDSATTATSDPATTAPVVTPTISAISVPLSACVREAAFTATVCGSGGIGPVATSGLLAVATAVPPARDIYWSDLELRYLACASICDNIPGCESYAVDRGNWPAVYSDWTCYFYGAGVEDYRTTFNAANNNIYWFSSSCYACAPREVLPAPSTPSTTSTSTAPSSTTSASTTITPFVAPTYQAPLAYSSTGNCRYPTGGMGSNRCVMSGFPRPTPTSLGLIAEATGIPPPIFGQFNYDFTPYYRICAGMCADIGSSCKSWVLDRGVSWTSAPNRPWNCSFFDFTVNQHLATGTGAPEFSGLVWFDDGCYSCDVHSPPGAGTLTMGLPSTTSTWSTSTTSSTSSSSSTATPQTTPPPTSTTNGIPTYLASIASSSLCTENSVFTMSPEFRQGWICGWTGRPRPDPTTSGLLAVATGIEYDLGGWEAICAAHCAETPGCRTFMVDRGSWPDVQPLWSCYLYDFDTAGYLGSVPTAVYNNRWVFYSNTCLNCDAVLGLPGSSSSSSSSTSVSTSTSTTATITGAPLPTGVPILAATRYLAWCQTNIGNNGACTRTGYPTATTGLLAVATGVPVITNSWQPAYDRCAGICETIADCRGYAIERNDPEADGYACYFYGINIPLHLANMAPRGDLTSVVWMDRTCQACEVGITAPEDPPPQPPPQPEVEEPGAVTTTTTSTSTTSTAAESLTTTTSTTSFPSSTTAPSTTSTWSTTTAPSTTAAPTLPEYGVPVVSAAQLPNSCWATQTWSTCHISGYPTPTTGLIAVATGIAGWPDSRVYEAPVARCANMCDGLEGCLSFAIDRSDMSNWKCLLYAQGFWDVYNAVYRNGSAAYNYLAWYDQRCHNCFDAVPWSVPGWPTTTKPPAPTYTAATSSGCNVVGEAPFTTCRASRYPTPKSGLLAVATGIPGSTNPDMAVNEPQVQRCARMCDGLAGCNSFIVNRTETENWNCMFYEQGAYAIIADAGGKYGRQEYDPLVVYDTRCHYCPLPSPWPGADAVAATTTTTSVSTTATSSSSSISSTTTSSTSSSTSTTTTSSSSTTSAAPTPTGCVRVANPDENLACDVRGFSQPTRAFDWWLGLVSHADCAALCAALNADRAGECTSFMWLPAGNMCGAWRGTTTWDVLGDGAMAGPSYRNNVIQDAGCWTCPPGAIYRTAPAAM